MIRFAKKMRNENGVSFDAVMAMAIHIDENLNPLTKFAENIPDKRWGINNANTCVKLLKVYYKDAECGSRGMVIKKIEPKASIWPTLFRH